MVKIACFILCDFYHNKKKAHILKRVSPRSVTPAAMEEAGTEVGSGKEERGKQRQEEARAWVGQGPKENKQRQRRGRPSEAERGRRVARAWAPPSWAASVPGWALHPQSHS